MGRLIRMGMVAAAAAAVLGRTVLTAVPAAAAASAPTTCADLADEIDTDNALAQWGAAVGDKDFQRYFTDKAIRDGAQFVSHGCMG